MAIEINSDYILNNDELKHHFKVYAGPGAGKTFFIVNNIKNLIKNSSEITESNERKALCITYTNSAVSEIQNRLDHYSKYVEINTIHGFIIEYIINQFQDDLIQIMEDDFNIKVSKGTQITSQIEGLGILHGIDKSDILSFIKSEDENCLLDEIPYSKKIMGDIEVDIETFIKSLKENQIKHQIKCLKNDSNYLNLFIKKYIWSKVRKLTHNEILYFGLRIIQYNPTALYYLRVKFPYIFVDEFQDTNPLQTLIIKLIGEKLTKIGVVGDLAQSIYSFQSAKPTDFKNFNINGRNDKIYIINNNRRSTKNIVNLCNFIRQEDTTIKQESIGENKENGKIHFLIGVSDNVKQTIKDIVKNDGVVLTRTWASAFDYIDNISEHQIKILKNIYNNYYNSPIQIRDEIIEHNNVTWVRAFKFVINLYEAYKTSSMIDLINAIQLYSKNHINNFSIKNIFDFHKLLSKAFESINDDIKTVNIIQCINNELKKDENIDIAEKLNLSLIIIFDDFDNTKLIENVKDLNWNTSLKLFQEVFSKESKYMTVHQAKGLEWNNVIVSLLPTKNDKTTVENVFQSPNILIEDSVSEFIRMYYVACSRAKENLYIHLPKEFNIEIIKCNLDSFCSKNSLEIQYEFIN